MKDRQELRELLETKLAELNEKEELIKLFEKLEAKIDTLNKKVDDLVAKKSNEDILDRLRDNEWVYKPYTPSTHEKPKAIFGCNPCTYPEGTYSSILPPVCKFCNTPANIRLPSCLGGDGVWCNSKDFMLRNNANPLNAGHFLDDVSKLGSHLNAEILKETTSSIMKAINKNNKISDALKSTLTDNQDSYNPFTGQYQAHQKPLDSIVSKPRDPSNPYWGF